MYKYIYRQISRNEISLVILCICIFDGDYQIGLSREDMDSVTHNQGCSVSFPHGLFYTLRYQTISFGQFQS